MCGLVGWVGRRVGEDTERDVAHALRSLAHRGPDASGVQRVDGPLTAVVGSSRLRILDLSPAGDMPMSTIDGMIRLAYNGEIYNHHELRQWLVAHGHHFRSTADTECLLHLYEELADDVEQFLQRLRGMFAVAIWDSRRQRLLLARDRLGIKPLTYAPTPGAIAFSSEARALVASGLVSGTPDWGALGNYLSWGWIPGPKTAFAAVSHIPPGHYLTWSGREAEVRRWWAPPGPALRGVGFGHQQAAKELGVLLDDAMRRHVISDRPVGVFLSGGIDSGVVATLAARHGVPRGVTISFPDVPELDESLDASRLARRLGIEHEVVPVTEADLLGSIQAALAGMDQPTGDSLNTWLVSHAATQSGLVVALSGLGGDELFSGYGLSKVVPRSRSAARALQLVPARPLRFLAGAASARWPGGRFVRIAGQPATSDGAYHAIRGVFGEADLATLGVSSSTPPSVQPPVGLDDVTALELANYLPDQLLRDSDTASMAHSLEVRVPLLDDALVDHVLRLPVDLRIGAGKALMTEATGFVPAGKKRGFAIPYQQWLKASLNETVREAILSDELPLSEFLHLKGRRRVWDAYQAGRTSWRGPWALAALRMWPAANGLSWS
jgi:asparagine synthase (glutamine-hydrolysing)